MIRKILEQNFTTSKKIQANRRLPILNPFLRQFHKNILKPTIIGIQYGNLNCRIAVKENKSSNPIIIPTLEGLKTTPAIIAFLRRREFAVGSAAKTQAIFNPQNTFYDMKKIIGRKASEEEIENISRNVSFKLVKTVEGEVFIETSTGILFSPTFLMSLILSNLKEASEKYLKNNVTGAVLTVPVYFNENQKTASEKAAKLAGFSVLQIVEEPVAAAIAYGFDTKDQVIAVFQLDSCSCSVSVWEIKKGVFSILSEKTDPLLGGEKFDNCVVDYITSEIRSEHEINVKIDNIAAHRLKEAVIHAKHHLSTHSTVSISLPQLTVTENGFFDYRLLLTRKKYETLVDQLMEKITNICQTAVAAAGVKNTDISQVVLVGGMTHIPKVKQVVESCFNKKSIDSGPEEAIPIGAAIYGAKMNTTNKAVVIMNADEPKLDGEIYADFENFQKLQKKLEEMSLMFLENRRKIEDDFSELAPHLDSPKKIEICAKSLGIAKGPRLEMLSKIILKMKYNPYVVKIKKTLDANGISEEEWSQGIARCNFLDGQVIHWPPIRTYTEEEVYYFVKELNKQNDHHNQMDPKIAAIIFNWKIV